MLHKAAGAGIESISKHGCFDIIDWWCALLFPILQIDFAEFNILPTLSVTLDETDRLWAEQTSTAVSRSALSLKSFESQSLHKMIVFSFKNKDAIFKVSLHRP